MRRMLPALLGVLALVASACAFGGPEPVEVQARFDDVMDMTELAPVFTGDVEIGTVTSIELSDDNQALVTMEVEPDTGLPSEVKAVVMQTSLLGERAVQLVPVNGSGELSSGTVPGEVQSDLEDLVSTGSDLLAFVAADRLNAMVHAGAVTFAEQGSNLGGLLEDFEIFVGEFDSRSNEITRLLDSLDAWLGTLAEQSEVNAESLEVLARSNQALMEEDDHLLDALEDLQELADNGERVLRENRQELDEFFAQLEVIVKAITGVEGALQEFLTYLPRHNVHVPNAQFFEFVQIWQDTVICGTDAEREMRDNPAKSCSPPNPGVSNEEPPGTRADRCDEEGVDCVRGHRTKNEPNDFGSDAGSDDHGTGTCDESAAPDTDTCPYNNDPDGGQGGDG